MCACACTHMCAVCHTGTCAHTQLHVCTYTHLGLKGPAPREAGPADAPLLGATGRARGAEAKGPIHSCSPLGPGAGVFPEWEEEQRRSPLGIVLENNVSYLSVTARRPGAGSKPGQRPRSQPPDPHAGGRPAVLSCPDLLGPERGLQGVCSQEPEVPKISLSMFRPQRRRGRGRAPGPPAAAAASSAQLLQRRASEGPSREGRRGEGAAWGQSPRTQVSPLCPWRAGPWVPGPPLWADPLRGHSQARGPWPSQKPPAPRLAAVVVRGHQGRQRAPGGGGSQQKDGSCPPRTGSGHPMLLEPPDTQRPCQHPQVEARKGARTPEVPASGPYSRLQWGRDHAPSPCKGETSLNVELEWW